MQLSQLLVLALSALPLTFGCPDAHFLFGHPDEKDNIINATRHRVEPRYAELLSSKYRSPWPINQQGDNRWNEVRFCYADVNTRAELKDAFEAGIILWEKALGKPGPESKHSLFFRETIDFHDGHYVYSRPLYCYEQDSYSGFGTGAWDDVAIPSGTLAVHLQQSEGAVSGQSGYTPDGDDKSRIVSGRHSIRIGKDPENDHIWAQPWLVAHEIGHILGMVHEHQRYDRDDYIQIYCTAIHDFEAAFTLASKDPINKQVSPAHIEWYLCNNEVWQTNYNFSTSASAFAKGAGFHQWDHDLTAEPGPGPDFDSIMMLESNYLAGGGCVHHGSDGKTRWNIGLCTMVMSYKDEKGINIWGAMSSRKKPSVRDVRFVQRFYPWPN